MIIGNKEGKQFEQTDCWTRGCLSILLSPYFYINIYICQLHEMYVTVLLNIFYTYRASVHQDGDRAFYTQNTIFPAGTEQYLGDQKTAKNEEKLIPTTITNN